MREIIIKRIVYEYDELSDEAKEKVRDDFLEIRRNLDWEFFEDDCEMDLQQIGFCNSGLKVQFSLSYCPGDGVNIYGSLDLREVWPKIKDGFTEKEGKFFDWAFCEFDTFVKMQENMRDAFCIADCMAYTGNIEWEMENGWYRDIPYSLLRKFDKLAGDYFTRLCEEYEKDGYEFFYEADEEDVRDWAESCGMEFDEDGKAA